jgi:hypothetical protein
MNAGKRARSMALATTLGVGSIMVVATTTGSLAAGASQSGAGDCVAHRFLYSEDNEISYVSGCSGHDEPELDPESSLAGSAQDLTWTAVLPSDGTVPVSAVGPTFWWGGTVSDPNPHALLGQAFLELQFYPDSIVKSCSSTGGFNVAYAPNKFSVCSPVWEVSTQSSHEIAAFNAELYDGASSSPLVMTGGDTVRIHFFMPSTPGTGWNVQVTDLTTGHSGLIVLNSKYGPLLPAYSQQEIGNALGWGTVSDTPNGFVWEIGHTSPYTKPAAQYCVPGQTNCASYDAAHWAGFTPLQIKSVTFADGSTANKWAVVSDLGGSAEVTRDCASYGGPYCIYPWYSLNSAYSAFTYGTDYPGTKFDYGQGSQFATTEQCGGPFGPNSTYCATVISPTH